MSSESPVFHDPEGRRWRRVKRTYLFLAVIVTALTALFIASVLANPVLPSFNLRQLDLLPHAADIKPKAPNIPANPSEQKAKKAQVELQRRQGLEPDRQVKVRTNDRDQVKQFSCQTPSELEVGLMGA